MMFTRRPLPRTLVVGAVLVAIVAGLTLLSLVWTPHDPNLIDTYSRFVPPGTDGYIFGTDGLGRDVLSVVLAGSRNSLLISVLSTSLALVVGTALGMAAAGGGPRWESLLTRVTDVGVAFPGILAALVLATVIGPGAHTAVAAIVVGFIPRTARTTIGPARQILALDFVEASFAYGRSRAYVLFRHVLPNIASLLIVLASVLFANAILIEAALSYLGVGTQPPTFSWGRMLNEAQPMLATLPTLTLLPGGAIVLSVLGFNLVGDGLREYLDPAQGAVGPGAALRSESEVDLAEGE